MATKFRVNKKRFVIELCAILLVASIFPMTKFVTWFLRQPLYQDPFSKQKDLYQKVLEFDYENGNHANLVKNLEKATESAGSEPVRYFFNLYAKATYYCRIEEYQKCSSAIDAAKNYYPTEEYLNDILILQESADAKE